jgi:hypothetical protein
MGAALDMERIAKEWERNGVARFSRAEAILALSN